MKDIVNLFSGRSTYALGFALLAYVIIMAIRKEPVCDEIVYGALAGMGITLRRGVSNISPPPT